MDNVSGSFPHPTSGRASNAHNINARYGLNEVIESSVSVRGSDHAILPSQPFIPPSPVACVCLIKSQTETHAMFFDNLEGSFEWRFSFEPLRELECQDPKQADVGSSSQANLLR